MFAIEKGIPIPGGSKLAPKYPFDKLDVNDSFFVPGARRATVGAAAYHFANKNGRKFTVRLVDDGVRVWRIA